MEAWEFPYGRAMEWRVVSGDPDGPGDGAAWSRTRIPVVAGEEPSGLQRAVLTADSGNGLSAALDWSRWSFVNIDLDVHLSRPLDGEWVLLDAAAAERARNRRLARRPRLVRRCAVPSRPGRADASSSRPRDA